MTDTNPEKSGELSVIKVMTDTNSEKIRKTVRHQCYDGHKSGKK
ncbi:hypothetical protein SAMD00020551_2473 [Mesobacillus selenatarsenatis SF-1]|uniref:Uncharacterized protein n=1 Tax=Mesobacillus selenatarsenatis (strain DSM 18680 / JCM 14380 / FERM P-15431 / SF-1) TaxID=1321606 RepID=A0A0A8X500_MESS1|nr:hypothetical protein SAMD00020551_2473 [Mesobacillus selenatarsenatis SF-1]